MCPARSPFPALLIGISLLLAGCGAPTGPIGLALSVAVVPPFGRTLPDLVTSLFHNQDCSMVRVEQGKSYCREPDPPPEPPRICTRSLASVDCWINPQALVGPITPVADGPTSLTPAQEAYRTRGWFW